jgi:hypothetical protein
MSRTEVPIRDIIADPDHPTDLSTLPPDELLARLETLYSFLPSVEGMSVADVIAAISIPEENPYRVEEALRLDELPADWYPAKEMRVTAWEMMHQLVCTLSKSGEAVAATTGSLAW